MKKTTFSLALATVAVAAQAIPEGVYLIDSLSASVSNPNGRRVARFSNSGTFIGNFIAPAQPTFTIPQVACKGPGDTMLVIDQTNNNVQQFDASGVFIGNFITGLDNARCISRMKDGSYLVTNSGTSQVLKYSASGSPMGVFATVTSPWFVKQFRNGDVYVTRSTTFSGGNTPQVERFSSTGTFLGNAITGYPFTQQIHECADGNLLLSVFSLPGATMVGNAVYEFSPGTTPGTWNQVFEYDIDGARGVMEMGDGRIIATGGTNVRIFDRNNTTGTPVTGFGESATGSSWRMIYNTNYPVPISYNLTPQDWAGAVPPPLDVTLRVYDNATQSELNQFSASATGENKYVVTTIRGNVDVYVTAQGHLTKKLAENVNLDDWGLTLPTFTLIGGDANGDNSVDLLDYFDLSDSYNLAEGDSGYNASADFNGDGSVDLLDYFILSDSYNLTGDELPPVPTN